MDGPFRFTNDERAAESFRWRFEMLKGSVDRRDDNETVTERANAKLVDGRTTLLMYAAEKGDVGSVQYLVARGADANVRNENHETPLVVASNKGFRNVVRILADITEVDPNDRTIIESTPDQSPQPSPAKPGNQNNRGGSFHR